MLTTCAIMPLVTQHIPFENHPPPSSSNSSHISLDMGNSHSRQARRPQVSRPANNQQYQYPSALPSRPEKVAHDRHRPLPPLPLTPRPVKGPNYTKALPTRPQPPKGPSEAARRTAGAVPRKGGVDVTFAIHSRRGQFGGVEF